MLILRMPGGRGGSQADSEGSHLEPGETGAAEAGGEGHLQWVISLLYNLSMAG